MFSVILLIDLMPNRDASGSRQFVQVAHRVWMSQARLRRLSSILRMVRDVFRGGDAA